jgi:hypothetical protein
MPALPPQQGPVVAQPTLAVPDPSDPVVLDPGLVLPVVLDPALVVPVVVGVVIPAVVEVEEEEEEEVLAQAPAVAFADLLVVVRETLVQSPVHLLVVLLFLRSATPRQAMPL